MVSATSPPGVSTGVTAMPGTASSVTSTIAPLKNAPASAGRVKACRAYSAPLKTENNPRNSSAGAVMRSSEAASESVPPS